MDEFKRYIDDHRDDFEVPAGGFDDLWAGIDEGIAAKENEEEEPRRIPLFHRKVWKVAAMLVMALGITWMTLQVNTGEDPIAKVPEWQETEQFYTTQIKEKMQVLETKRGQLDHSVFDDLDMLDAAFLELKKDLQDNADNQEVIEAMIESYQIKLQILEEILQEIEADETENTDNPIAAT